MDATEITKIHKTQKKHDFYSKAVEKAEDFWVHANGVFSKKLIGERRPGEKEIIMTYRKDNFVSMSKPVFKKVYNSLMKIRKADDWNIKYPEKEEPKIAKGETLKEYSEIKFPFYTSFTNWFFSLAFRTYLCDANAVILWIPINPVKEGNNYYQPYPYIFKSENIIDYKKEEWYLLKTEGEYSEKLRRNKCVYYYTDTTQVQKFVETSVDSNITFAEEPEIKFGFGYVPVTTMEGVVINDSVHGVLYESRIESLLPYLKEIDREYSDNQAEVMQHVHTSRWYYSSLECRECKGVGKIITEKEKTAPKTCKACNGKGSMPINPFEDVVLRLPRVGETQVPVPPGGVFNKTTDIVKIQDERLRNHKKDAVGSLNMQFLEEVPLNESGISKEWDRTESDNTVHSIAEDIVRILDSGYKTIANWRYFDLLGSEEKVKEIVPTINVPVKYNIIPLSYQLAELEALKNAKVDPVLVNAAMKEFSSRRFNTDDQIKKFIDLAIDIDVFAGVDDGTLEMRLMNGLIDKTAYKVHCNTREIVEIMIQETATEKMKTEDKISRAREIAETLVDETELPDDTPEEGAANK